MRTPGALIATIVVSVWAGVWTPVTQSFILEVHERILRDTLGDGNTMEADALERVITANRHSDYHQLTPEQHFDNAPNPAVICQRWAEGLNRFLNDAIEASAPKGEEKRELRDRFRALDAIGRATHAIADFYSHTNWIELTGAIREVPLKTARLLNDTCNPNDFPSMLQSGYFGIQYAATNFCPVNDSKLVPPQEFRDAGGRYCHAIIAKDDPDQGHGAQTPPHWSHTYHELAVDLARRATRELWDAMHDRIVAKYSKDKATDAECLFMKLAWGKDRTCHRLWKLEGRAHSLTPTAQGELAGLEAHISWQPQPYPGPNAPEVYAKIEGTWSIRGTEHGTFSSAAQMECTWESEPIDAKGADVNGRIKMVPESVPLDSLGNIWIYPAPGQLRCQSPSVGEPFLRSVPTSPMFLANYATPVIFGKIFPCNPPPQPLDLRLDNIPQDLAGGVPERKPQHLECDHLITDVRIRVWIDVVVSLDTP